MKKKKILLKNNFKRVKYSLGINSKILILVPEGALVIKDLLTKKIILNAFYISAAGSTVFAFFSIWNYFLLFGWLTGSLVSITCFFVNALLMQKIFEIKPKEKSSAFFLGFMRFYLNLLFHAGFFVSFIFINKFFSQKIFRDFSENNFINPINIFTYIIGLSVVMIAVLILNFSNKKKRGSKIDETNSR